ncbi:(d)CMP kinase [candidate division KSB1 bacterium]|nr:(d)CMP kinase [candidate division KSB1 bacterium]
MKKKNFIVAIDGPAGSGKSTTAILVAAELKFAFLDSGAMYRTIALGILRRGVGFDNPAKIVEVLFELKFDFQFTPGRLLVILDGEDVTDSIRSPEVNQVVAIVAAIPEIRRQMLPIQRKVGNKISLVAEGRDVGTVVFPKADLKIFLTASIEARAQRRYLELIKKHHEVSLEAIKQEIELRDLKDKQRELSPLVKAADAIELDTSNLTITEQVNFIVQKARERIR